MTTYRVQEPFQGVREFSEGGVVGLGDTGDVPLHVPLHEGLVKEQSSAQKAGHPSPVDEFQDSETGGPGIEDQ